MNQVAARRDAAPSAVRAPHMLLCRPPPPRGLETLHSTLDSQLPSKRVFSAPRILAPRATLPLPAAAKYAPELLFFFFFITLKPRVE